jgi:hypothetical protein
VVRVSDRPGVDGKAHHGYIGPLESARDAERITEWFAAQR